MAIYLVKSVMCSAILLLAYQLLLKNKTTYQFNRAYLLLSLAFSLTIPFITIKESAGVLAPAQPLVEQLKIFRTDGFSTGGLLNQTEATGYASINQSSAETYHMVYLLGGLYGLVAFALFARFAKNVVSIKLSAKNNEKLLYRDAWVVLVPEKLTPHTFLNYIFINRNDYANNRIENEVLKHELTHARQWHSADVIFIEMLQVLWWFNPFIFLYRKAIQLNHEFIADAVVINENNNISSYQHLLLDKISGLAAPDITCQFNYSVTKKRLIMMTKNTSAKLALLSRLSTLPVLALAFVLFCTTTKAQKQPQAATKKQLFIVASDYSKRPPVPPRIMGEDNYPHTTAGATAEQMTEYADITAKYMDKFKVGKPMVEISPKEKEKLEKIYKQMSLKQQRKQTICFYYSAPPPPPFSPSQKQLSSWLDSKMYGVWIDDKKVDNEELAKYKPEDFSNYFSSRLTPKAIHHKDYKYQVDLMTNSFYKKYRDEKIKNRFKSYMYFRVGKAFRS